MAFNVLKRIHYFFLRRKKPAGTCKMFELNLPTHNITCVVPDKGSCGIVHKKMPQRPLNNYRSVFLFLPPPSALPDSRHVRVTVSGRCREFAIPFSTTQIPEFAIPFSTTRFTQVGIQHRPKVQHASFCRLPRHQCFLTRAMSAYRFLAAAGNSPFR